MISDMYSVTLYTYLSIYLWSLCLYILWADLSLHIIIYYDVHTVGVVLTVEAVPKKSDLKKCTIDVTGDGSGSSVTVVTNAKHIAAGWRVVVALENAVVPAGANPEEDSDVVVVKKTSVVSE